MLLASPPENHNHTTTSTHTLPQHINMNSNSTGPTGNSTCKNSATNGSRSNANSSNPPKSTSLGLDENSSRNVNVSYTGISPPADVTTLRCDGEECKIGSDASRSPPSSSIAANTENWKFTSSGSSLGIYGRKGLDSHTDSTNNNSQDLTPVVARPTRESVLRLLSDALMRRSLTKINLSQVGLRPSDARLVKLALLQNSSLSVLNLGYNNLCDEGIVTLASGISNHTALTSLDVGFNNVGNIGCAALAKAILSTAQNENGSNGFKMRALHTLYLAGNSITEEGALSLAQLFKEGNGLRRIHLTENRIGPGATKALMDAITENEVRSRIMVNENGISLETKNHDCSVSHSRNSVPDRSDHVRKGSGVEELFLGGTGMGHIGCAAVANFLGKSKSLRVLCLSNCCLDDDDAEVLATAITKNCKELPLERLQLSFNNLTSKGVETLMNAVWGLNYLRDLQLDHNRMESRGAQLVSAVLKGVKTLKRLDVGFNVISGTGMKLLMKTVSESQNLESLSISGNTVDLMSAKAVSYALAHNKSLKSVFFDDCKIPSQGQRDITAGIVSNSNTRLEILTGFNIGCNAVSLGLPGALGKWTNEQVLKFVLFMMDQRRQEQQENILHTELDPLHLLPSVEPIPPVPLDPNTVVSVANRAFESLSPTGDEILCHNVEARCAASFVSPLTEDAVILESNGPFPPSNVFEGQPYPLGTMQVSKEPQCQSISGPLTQNRPIADNPLTAASKKKMIEKWLSQNIHHLNELPQLPFNSNELWRLHQHFFSPTIQVTCRQHNEQDSAYDDNALNSFASSNGAPVSSILSAPCGVIPGKTKPDSPTSEPVIHGTMPMLKRKVSYRYLGEANITSTSLDPERNNIDASVSKLIETMSGQSMQPRSKRARRNQSRISIVPRIKEKLDSFLDRDHQKALGFMRQLHYVEKSLLNGSIYPIGDLETATHLIGSLAADAEKILLDYFA